MKRFDDSLQESHDVLRIDPKNVKGLYRKATVLEMLGKRQEALKVVQEFMGIQGSKDTDVKLFQSLYVQIQKGILEDDKKSKELAKKMVNQSDQKEQGSEKKDEMWVQDLPEPDVKDILTEETKD